MPRTNNINGMTEAKRPEYMLCEHVNGKCYVFMKGDDGWWDPATEQSFDDRALARTWVQAVGGWFSSPILPNVRKQPGTCEIAWIHNGYPTHDTNLAVGWVQCITVGAKPGPYRICAEHLDEMYKHYLSTFRQIELVIVERTYEEQIELCIPIGLNDEQAKATAKAELDLHDQQQDFCDWSNLSWIGTDFSKADPNEAPNEEWFDL